jgi:predicted Holliday junction resolvase-like endonuclease
MLNTLLILLVVLMSVTLILLIVGVAIYLRRLNAATQEVATAARDAAESFRAARDAVVPLANDTRLAVANLNELVSRTRAQIETVERVTGLVERVLEGRTITDAAEKAVSTSRSTLLAALEGVKEGLKSLRRSKHVKEEEHTDG